MIATQIQQQLIVTDVAATYMRSFSATYLLKNMHQRRNYQHLFDKMKNIQNSVERISDQIVLQESVNQEIRPFIQSTNDLYVTCVYFSKTDG